MVLLGTKSTRIEEESLTKIKRTNKRNNATKRLNLPQLTY